MPAEKNVDNIPDGDAYDVEGQAPDTDNAEGSIYDNMTAEELREAVLEKEKGYKELHSKMGQMSGEVGELRKLKQSLEADNKLADVLKVATELAANKDKKPEQTYEELEASIIEEAQENPGAAMKRFMRTNASWAAQDQRATASKIEALEARLAQMGEVVQTTDEDYKQNKELIEKLRGKGMSIADAKAFAKDIRSEYAPETRLTPPGSISPNRVVARDKPAPKPWTEEDVARWKANGESDGFIENMKFKRERDAALTAEQKDNF